MALYQHLGSLLAKYPNINEQEGTFYTYLCMDMPFEQIGREMKWQEALKPPQETLIKESLLGW